MSYRPKTVWILGSGFSRSLGGPLLNDLLGARSQEETHVMYPELGDRAYVYDLFRKHRGTLWEHAEDFMEYVDTALTPKDPRAGILSRHLNNLVAGHYGQRSFNNKGLRRDAVLTVAAECSTYVDRADVGSERWRPYVRWATHLGDQDSIVTFNYDRVLEKLGTHNDVKAIGQETIAFPKQPQKGTEDGAGCAPIYKVHGSVDWAFQENGPIKPIQKLKECTEPDDFVPLIATPGSTKANYCSKLLSDVWDRAMQRIKAAEVIVFLGYRFPDTDPEACGRILDAIRANEQRVLRVFTVLGTDTGAAASVRLKRLLEGALKERPRYPFADLSKFGHARVKPHMYDVIQEPLRAEDLLLNHGRHGFYDIEVAKVAGTV